MTDHRRVQRALFRMQLDPAFARAVFAGEDGALGSTGLGAEDLELLRALDPAGVDADPGGRRRTQVLGNAASEYALTVACAERGGALPGLLEGFASAPELHEALCAEGRLPLAFGDYALRRAREAQREPLAALALLEREMARARRGGATAPPPAAGTVARGPRARCLELPEGTLALAASLRQALDSGREARPDVRVGPGREVALLVAAERESPHRLPEVAVERLEPAVAELLALAERPLDAETRARFARERGAEPAELEAFVDALVVEGVLVRGPSGA